MIRDICFIRTLQVKPPRNVAEERTAERMEAQARATIQAEQLRRAPNVSDNPRERHRREVETQEAQISRLVNQLYGVEAPIASSRRAAATEDE